MTNRLCRVLAELGVDDDTEGDVDNGDEGHGDGKTLPEIERVAHLSEESNEEESSTISVDNVIYGSELSGESVSGLLVRIWDNTSEGLDRLDNVDQGGGLEILIVRGVFADGHDDDQEADNVHPDRSVCQPSNTVKTANVTCKGTEDGKDENADDVADAILGKLTNKTTRCQDEHGDGHKLLNRLCDVDEVARFLAEDTEESVTVRNHREAGRVESQEDLPQDPAGE